MTDKPTHQDRLRSILLSEGDNEHPPKLEADSDEAEASGKAFGYMRGIKDMATSVEFRFLDGNSVWFPYGWLGPWRYDPSEGILLKFSGDLVYLVLIRGSNLDLPLNDGAPNLTNGGIQRHRVLWIREMNEEDIRNVGDKGPTIDSIRISEFESHSDLKEWLRKNAPAFIK